MSDIVYRQMRPEDVEDALALRNEVFSDAPITRDDWERDNALASLALLDGRVVGAIPLFERQLTISPGLLVRAPFENSVGTRADLRSRGIGSGMIVSAREFMRGRADGLFVYRNDERSDGYRFYTRSGHFDLMYTRLYTLSQPQSGTSEGAVLAGEEAICSLAAELLPLFLSTYGNFGGFPPRHVGYWRRALASSLFAEIPTTFYLLPQRSSSGALTAYAIVGIPTQEQPRRVQVMEMATRGGDLSLAAHILARVIAFAEQRDLPVEMELSAEDPFAPVLSSFGFAAAAREMILMGQLLDPSAFFQRYWQPRVDLHGLGLRVSTERRDYLCLPPAADYPTLTLEMKEETLHRWLLSRINLPARLHEGTITAYGPPAATALRALSTAIPLTPWAYHRLDWL